MLEACAQALIDNSKKRKRSSSTNTEPAAKRARPSRPNDDEDNEDDSDEDEEMSSETETAISFPDSKYGLVPKASLTVSTITSALPWASEGELVGENFTNSMNGNEELWSHTDGPLNRKKSDWILGETRASKKGGNINPPNKRLEAVFERYDDLAERLYPPYICGDDGKLIRNPHFDRLTFQRLCLLVLYKTKYHITKTGEYPAEGYGQLSKEDFIPTRFIEQKKDDNDVLRWYERSDAEMYTYVRERYQTNINRAIEKKIKAKWKVAVSGPLEKRTTQEGKLPARTRAKKQILGS